MSKNNIGTVQGLSTLLEQLERLGREGKAGIREAATKAATMVRQQYIVQALSSATGVSVGTIMRYSYVKKATAKYDNARINFSGSAIPVALYRYRPQKTGRAGRARILVDWVGGGTKVAAGFINPLGNGIPLSTRNVRRHSLGRLYVYRKGQMATAMGPSVASMYEALPKAEVENESVVTLNSELAAMLDELLGE